MATELCHKCIRDSVIINLDFDDYVARNFNKLSDNVITLGGSTHVYYHLQCYEADKIQ